VDGLRWASIGIYGVVLKGKPFFAFTALPQFFFPRLTMAQLWRIKKLGKMRKQTVLPRHVIWPFLLFMVISFGILVAWTIVDPSEFDRVEVGINDDFYEPTSFPLCTYEIGFQTASQVPLLISMAIVWYMSYKTRELPEKVTDSRRIARVLLSHVLITLSRSHWRTRNHLFVCTHYFSQFRVLTYIQLGSS
jgi:hypothetical protein